MSKDLLPSQRAEKRAVAQAELEAAKKEAHQRIVSAMRTTFASPDGQIVLKWLHDQCGYAQSKVVANPQTGEINTLSTAYQAIRETTYINIRKFLTFDILKEVEYEPE